jgi:hypothetical protein
MSLPAFVVEAAEARGILDPGSLQVLLMTAIENHDAWVRRWDEEDPMWREHEDEVAEEIGEWRRERRAASASGSS